MNAEIVKSNGAQIHKMPQAPLDFSPEQRQIILDSFLNGASEAEAKVLMELARVRRLNPITKQIHFVKRWDSMKGREVWAAQVGIDGFRAIAERTGVYDGQDEPVYEYDAKGALKLCKVSVYRKDISRPFVGVAHFSEYVQTKKDKTPNSFWAEKPHIMLAKCAEALAFRKGFPEDLSGLFAPEEMPDEREVNPAPVAKVLPQQAAPKTNGNDALKAKLVERKMPPILDGDPNEPPPLTDADAPSPEAAYEEAAGVGRESDDGVMMSYGPGKGQPLSGLEMGLLNWYSKTLNEKIADPEKARYLDDNKAKLSAIGREIRRRI
jgi:phage recombination protein Bet